MITKNKITRCSHEKEFLTPSLRNESGAALIVALLLMVVMLSLVPVAMQLTSGDMDRSENFKDDRQLFYLAEAGLEHGQSVLKASELDTILAGPDGDKNATVDNGTVAGVGMPVTWNGNLYNQVSMNGGTYNFRVYDNDDGDSDLNGDADGLGFIESVGISADGTTKTMRAMLHKIKVALPPAAVTVVGPTTEIELEHNAFSVQGEVPGTGHGYAIDGTEDTSCAGKNGVATESPGPVEIVVDIPDGDEGDETPCGSATCIKLEHDATGAEITGIGGGTAGNPDVVAGQTSLTAQDAANLHNQLTQIETPDYVYTGNTILSSNQTFGSPTDPKVVYFDSELEITANITGYGILIVDQEFEVEDGGSLNWTGIVMFGACATCTIAEFEPNNSTIYGSIVAGGDEIEFEDTGVIRYSCEAIALANGVFDQIFKVVSWKEIS